MTHALTNLMYRKLKKDHTREEVEEVDEVVREWLEEVAEKIKAMHDIYEGHFDQDKYTRRILSLSEAKQDPKESNVWCKHLLGTPLHPENYHFVYESKTFKAPEYWDICPVKDCHAPRPESKSLEDKLFNIKLNETGAIHYLTMKNAEDIASIARQHFAEGGK